MDARGLFDVVMNEDISMCGFGPTVAMLTAVRRLGATGDGTGQVRDFRRYFRRPRTGRGICGHSRALAQGEDQTWSPPEASEPGYSILEFGLLFLARLFAGAVRRLCRGCGLRWAPAPRSESCSRKLPGLVA